MSENLEKLNSLPQVVEYLARNNLYAYNLLYNEAIHTTAMMNREHQAAGGKMDHTAEWWGKRYMEKDYWWVAREAARFRLGIYQPIPNDYLRLPLRRAAEHFIHQSIETPGMIAYTPSAEYGKQDRQVVTSVGKYIKKYFPDLYNDNEINNLASRYKALTSTDNVFFATTREQIHGVYMRSATKSCMTHEVEKFNRYIHPTEAYGGLMTAVAFIPEDLEDPWNSRVLSRTVVVPSQKRFVRIFGSSELQFKLAALGYRQTSLNGVLVQALRIPNRQGEFACPYFDGGAQSVRLIQHPEGTGEYMTIGDYGAVERLSEYRAEWAATGSGGSVGFPIVGGFRPDGTYFRANAFSVFERGGLNAYLAVSDIDDDDNDEDNERYCEWCGEYHHEDDGSWSEYHDCWVCDDCMGECGVEVDIVRRGYAYTEVIHQDCVTWLYVYRASGYRDEIPVEQDSVSEYTELRDWVALSDWYEGYAFAESAIATWCEHNSNYYLTADVIRLADGTYTITDDALLVSDSGEEELYVHTYALNQMPFNYETNKFVQMDSGWVESDSVVSFGNWLKSVVRFMPRTELEQAIYKTLNLNRTPVPKYITNEVLQYIDHAARIYSMENPNETTASV